MLHMVTPNCLTEIILSIILTALSKWFNKRKHRLDIHKGQNSKFIK